MADCPYCMQPGASRFLWFVRCPNAGCPKYDESLQKISAREMSRPKKGRVSLSSYEGPQAIAGSVPGQGLTPAGLLRGARYVIGYVLIAAAILLYVGEKTGAFRSGVQGKNLFWMGLLGYWIIPSKKKPPAEESLPEEEEDGEQAAEERPASRLDRRY